MWASLGCLNIAVRLLVCLSLRRECALLLYRPAVGRPMSLVASRFLITWTSFLPFALYSRFQWLTPFVAAMITFLLFGVRPLRPLHCCT